MTTTSQPLGRNSAWTRDMLSFWPPGTRAASSPEITAPSRPTSRPTSTAPEKLVHFTVVPGQPPERRPSPLDLRSSWHQREAANPAEVVSRVVEMVAGATNAEDGDFLRRHHLPRRGRDDVSVGSQKTRVELALVSDREVVLRPEGAVVDNRGAVRVMHVEVLDVEVLDVEVLDADLLDAGFRGSGLLDAGLLDSGVLGRGVLGRRASWARASWT